MLVKAHLSNLRIAPRKVRLVADLIRGKKIEEAQRILNFTVRGASRPVFKLLKQAEANASNNFQLDPANLFVYRITVDEGAKLKRWMPRSRGQTYEIQKKTSHITIILDELVKGKEKTSKTRKPKIKADAREDKSPSSPAEALDEAKKRTRLSSPAARIAEKLRPKREKGINKIFRRKAI